MAQVVLDSVTKIYPGGVVGPSGCGKSTTLRMIAGLEDVTAGQLCIGDRVVNDVPPKDRDIAMVFQNYALYPHMTVYKNMAFGLRLRKYPKQEIRKRVLEAATILGIEELLERKPSALSGGQRQRVAVGRAIVRNPEAFLFDEPLSNLDAKLRVEMRAELKRLHRQLQTTTVYVTHDQEEAMTLGDRIVVMRDGLVHQCDTPLRVYEQPVDRFVAGFVGTPPMNFLSGRLASADGHAYWEGVGTRVRLADAHREALAGRAGEDATLGVRPEAMIPSAEQKAAGADNALPVTVSVVEVLGDKMDVHATVQDGTPLVARVDAHAGLEEGQQVQMHLDTTRVHVFEPGDMGANLCLGGVAARASA